MMFCSSTVMSLPQSLEVTEAYIVAASDLLHGRMGNSREESHDEAQQDGADGHHGSTLEAAYREDDADHAGHVKSVMTREEDELQRGETGDEHVGHHTEGHDKGRMGTIFLKGHAHDSLIVGHDTVDAETILEHIAEVAQSPHGQAGTAAQDQDAHDGLDGTLQGVRQALLLSHQTNE